MPPNAHRLLPVGQETGGGRIGKPQDNAQGGTLASGRWQERFACRGATSPFCHAGGRRGKRHRGRVNAAIRCLASGCDAAAQSGDARRRRLRHTGCSPSNAGNSSRTDFRGRNSMIDVEEINDPEQLADRRLLWNALLPQTPGATFFQSLDWLEVYCRHFAAAQRLRVLVVSADGRPVGILPLVVRTERTRVGRVRTLTYPLARLGHVLWSHRPQSHGHAPGGPAPRPPHAARLGHARPPLGRRGWLRPRADRAAPWN